MLGLEQFDIPHARGSSHGFSRAIRLAYYEHPDYVPLLRRTYALWRELEAQTGQQLLTITGGLYFGAHDNEQIRRTIASADEYGVTYEYLDRQALAERFPQFRLPDDFHAVLGAKEASCARSGHRRAGHGRAQARRCAARPRAGAGLACRYRGVSVTTERGEYRAERLILCGGAWSSSLLGELNVQLRVSRQPVAWFWPRRPDLFALGQFPLWMLAHADGSSHYGFPMLPDNPGFKVARHWPGPTADPDQLQRDPLPGDEADCRAAIDQYLPDAAGPLLALRVCMYTHSPDCHFIVDRHPRLERVTVACGFSGHGFKFAPVMGELLADLALTGRSDLPASFLGLGRFEAGR